MATVYIHRSWRRAGATFDCWFSTDLRLIFDWFSAVILHCFCDWSSSDAQSRRLHNERLCAVRFWGGVEGDDSQCRFHQFLYRIHHFECKIASQNCLGCRYSRLVPADVSAKPTMFSVKSSRILSKQLLPKQQLLSKQLLSRQSVFITSDLSLSVLSSNESSFSIEESEIFL